LGFWAAEEKATGEFLVWFHFRIVDHGVPAGDPGQPDRPTPLDRIVAMLGRSLAL